MAVAIFHGLGIQLLESAADKDITVLSSLRSHAGNQAVAVLTSHVTLAASQTDVYVLGDYETYPYYRVKVTGSLFPERMFPVIVPDECFDVSITGSPGSVSRRFFKKKGSEALVMNGVDMERLEAMCFQASDAVVSMLGTLMLDGGGSY